MSENKKQRSASVSCSEPRLQNLLIFYLNSHVSKRVRQRIDEHLAHCSDCTETIRLLTLVKRIEKKKKRYLSTSTGR